MILISFFDALNQKSGKILTYLGVLSGNKISVLLIKEFWLDVSKNGTNTIRKSLKNTHFSKVTRLWIKNIRIQTDVAGTIF